jgi:hypothetical protein
MEDDIRLSLLSLFDHANFEVSKLCFFLPIYLRHMMFQGCIIYFGIFFEVRKTIGSTSRFLYIPRILSRCLESDCTCLYLQHFSHLLLYGPAISFYFLSSPADPGSS